MADAVSKRCVLIFSTLASFMPAFVNSAVIIALPTIGTELSMDAVLLGWVPTAHLLSMAIFLVIFGRAADIYGRRRIFLWGMIIYTAFSFLSAVPRSPLELIAFRFLHGVGSAMIFSTAVAILTSVFSPGERGRALGINVTAVYLGLSLGPVLGGILTQYLGWRSIFFVQVPLGLVVIGLILGRMNGEWVEAKGEGFDLTGSMLYGLSLATLIYGLSLLPSSVGVGFLLLSALGLYAFLTWESRAKHPIINLIIFRENRVFALSNLATLINYAASFAVTFVLSLYLQYIQGLDPRSSGLVLMAQPLTQALLSYPAGSLSDRMETRVVASAGMVVTALGLLMLTFLDAGTDLAFILISIAVLGVGLALFSSPNTNAVMSSVERRHYGVASGMLGTMRTIGMMLSMAIVMLIIALFVGRVEILPENHRLFLQSIRAIFYLFLVLCLLGTLASLARGKVRPS